MPSRAFGWYSSEETVRLLNVIQSAAGSDHKGRSSKIGVVFSLINRQRRAVAQLAVLGGFHINLYRLSFGTRNTLSLAGFQLAVLADENSHSRTIDLSWHPARRQSGRSPFGTDLAFAVNCARRTTIYSHS